MRGLSKLGAFVALSVCACGTFLDVDVPQDPGAPSAASGVGIDAGAQHEAATGSVVVPPPPPPPPSECADRKVGDECKGGVCYPDGSCVPLVDEGGECMAPWQCANGSRCQPSTYDPKFAPTWLGPRVGTCTKGATCEAPPIQDHVTQGRVTQGGAGDYGAFHPNVELKMIDGGGVDPVPDACACCIGEKCTTGAENDTVPTCVACGIEGMTCTFDLDGQTDCCDGYECVEGRCAYRGSPVLIGP